VAARKAGFDDVPQLCAGEIDVPGALPRVVRLLAHVHIGCTASEIRHVYLRGAQALRQDR
jgi:chorismate mutase